MNQPGLGCPTSWHVPKPEWLQVSQVRPQHLGASHVRLECGIPRQAQDPGLGTGLAGELWVLCWWAAAPANDHESQSWGWVKLVKATVPCGIRVAGSGAGWF